MKNNCKIVIEDLLPLYIDGVISEDGKELVDSHLKSCEKCKLEYERLNSSNEFEPKNNIENSYRSLAIKLKRKRYIIFSFIGLIFLILISLLLYTNYPRYSSDHEWVKEYVVGEEGIKGSFNKNQFGDNENYEVGADKYGNVVFKDPNSAFRQMKNDYAKGLKTIKNEYKLLSINRYNFHRYYTLSCQMSEIDNFDTMSQVRSICLFMDVYENSFSNNQLFSIFFK